MTLEHIDILRLALERLDDIEYLERERARNFYIQGKDEEHQDTQNRILNIQLQKEELYKLIREERWKNNESVSM